MCKRCVQDQNGQINSLGRSTLTFQDDPGIFFLLMESSPTHSKSQSQARISLMAKFREWALIFRGDLRAARSTPDSSDIFTRVEEYRQLLDRYTGKKLMQASLFDIGYGPRPYALLALIGLGIDARGIDMDAPVLRGRPSEFWRILKTNGLERAVKSAVIFFCFSAPKLRSLQRELRRRGGALVTPPGRLLVGDAGQLDLPAGSLDLIVSEDVFEHISQPSLEAVVARMARWLKPDGLALVRPCIYTGLWGGHLAEWCMTDLDDPRIVRRSQPWDHLRQRQFRPNTYLNELSRADFRDLFRRHFEIQEETVRNTDLGRRFMTPEIRAELGRYPDEELFSNQVLFVLRPKRS